MPKPQIQFVETEYGIWQKSRLPNVSDGTVGLTYAHFFMPAGFMRVQTGLGDKGLVRKYQSWYVPIDDWLTKRFLVGFAPLGNNQQPYQWPSEQDFLQPGPDNDYFRNYNEVDTISGIPGNAPGTAVKGFLVQDNMVNETQGPIVDRREEHLGMLDKVLTAMRVMCRLAIEDVEKGRDPKHIIRDPAKNEMVAIAGTDELELA